MAGELQQKIGFDNVDSLKNESIHFQKQFIFLMVSQELPFKQIKTFELV